MQLNIGKLLVERLEYFSVQSSSRVLELNPIIYSHLTVNIKPQCKTASCKCRLNWKVGQATIKYFKDKIYASLKPQELSDKPLEKVNWYSLSFVNDLCLRITHSWREFALLQSCHSNNKIWCNINIFYLKEIMALLMDLGKSHQWLLTSQREKETTWHYMASEPVHNTTYDVFLPKMKPESDQPQDLITNFQVFQRTEEHVR